MKLTKFVAAAGLVAAVGVGGLALAGPAAAYPAGTACTASINKTAFTGGETVTVDLAGCTPGDVTMLIESTPRVIGAGSVDAQGNGSVAGVIPECYSGSHSIIVDTAGNESIPAFGITVTAAAGCSASGGGDDDGDLASTGAAVTGIAILGGVLVAGGVFFVVAGRRRTVADNSTIA